MKFLKSRFFIICVAVVLVLVLIPTVMSAMGKTDLLRGALVTVAKPFSWCASKVADAFNGFTSAFTDYDRLKQENEELRATVESLQDREYNDEVVRRENAWLKEYLNLHTNHPEYVLSDARIIARESGNYATVLTLDRGRVHKITEKMPVITEAGLFGYVSEVGLDWCRVVTLVETASAVGVYTDRGNVTGIVEGDSELRGGGTCRMTYIDSGADIRVGDKVYTSGNGSFYPAGLLIGTVTSLEADENTRSLTAEIQPAVDFTNLSSLSRIMIISGYAGQEAQ